MATAQGVRPSLVDPEAEGAYPERRRELQEYRLRRLVDRLLAADGMQAGRLRDCGVSRGSDVGLDQLHRLPFVCQQDFWDHYPFGLRAASEADIVCVHGSSGTMGRTTLVPYTAHDVDVWAQVMARALGGAGVTRRSFVHCAYGYGLFTGGLGVHHGATRLGATVVPVSSGATDRQLRLLLDLRPDVLCCTPSYAIYLGEALASTGIVAEQLSLRVGLFGAEPWTAEMRLSIEGLLGLRALNIYGLTEVIGPGVACESLDSEGLLNIAEDHFYPEVVGPDGAPLPAGEVGELVFTTLTKTGTPLLRYRTGDVASLSGPAPGSARTLRRMSRVFGRTDDMLVIRGTNVFPSEIETVLLADRRVAPHYLIVEDRRDQSRPELRIAVEPRDPHGDAEVLERELAGALYARLGISCIVRVLPPDHLPREESGKTPRLVRWEHGVVPLPGLE
ncbi:phenylacetate--CoA ligase family protein [Saccharopolyspora phatthalungensis]|uniref:Phenylacetate-coenzyme A ligase n=1 Tax=Saccharopolyspora phatthalungensis TaxID=664693 RepID=A0A840PZZ6_9PSEU|nr:AMP-binding protein [Saccharopolyspora phatthalungensis]MBB5153317.1 phenylacetate-CoA ligase [Saccharopolyspora phatthalungensis]